MQPELRVRKILGKTFLNENRLSEALDIFVKILTDYPDDIETLLILAGCYLAGGDGVTAKKLYLRAQQLDPQNKAITYQIRLAEELQDDERQLPISSDMDSVTRLLQRLTGKPHGIEEREIMRAADLLDKIINSRSPADIVSTHLDEIDDLLQALIEINIRQARADGRRDVAEALYHLQLNIDFQLAQQDDQQTFSKNQDELEQPASLGNLLMLLPDLGKKSNRMMLLKSALESAGCHVVEKNEYKPDREARPDLVITSNPHTHPALIESLSALSNAGIPITLDIDTDFNDQPILHTDYENNGLATQERNNAYTASFAFADLITVSSDMQAAAIKNEFAPVVVIPDGWSRRNRLWEKAPPAHTMINIGWLASGGELEDLMLVRRFIIRIIREFPNTRIVIVGNPEAYRLFDGLPENRRMYIPLVADEEFPYLLSQIDILLVPLRNSPYNLSLPDTVLMQAGVSGVPWLATPIPSFRAWKDGGILIETIGDEWHLNLRHLVMDQELRNGLGQAGRNAARSREMGYLGKVWLETFSQLLNQNGLSKMNWKQIRA